MKAALRLLLATAAVLGASGCRTAPLNAPARPVPPEPKSSLRVSEFVEQHNRNADLIDEVFSRTSVTGSIGAPREGDEKQSGSFYGTLAIHRPRDFKLDMELKVTGVNVADIGSNDERFWFWFRNDDKGGPKHVYYCTYDDPRRDSLAATYQPDWILDSLGLRAITPEEARAAKVEPGPKAGTSRIWFTPSRDFPCAREMVVWDASKRVDSYRIFDADGRTPIGEARIAKYTNQMAKSKRSPGTEEACYLPDRLALEWKRERLMMDISLSSPTINKRFTDKQLANFAPPKLDGYTNQNLAMVAQSQAEVARGETVVRETMPAPHTRGSRVQLEPPVSIEGDEPMPDGVAAPANSDAPAAQPAPRSRGRSRTRPEAPSPGPSSTGGGPTLLPVHDDVVGAARVKTPDSPFSQIAGPDQVASGFAFEP